MMHVSGVKKSSELLASGQFLGPVAVTILGFLTAIVVVQANSSQLFIFLSLLFAIIVFSRESFGLVLLFPISFYFLYLKYILSIPAIFSNITYIIVLLLALRKFLSIILKKDSLPKTSLDRPVLLLFAFIIVSFLLSRPPLGPALKSIIIHTSFILLFFVLSHSNLKESVLKLLFHAIFVVAAVQVLASFIQYFFIFYDMPPGFRYDKSCGLFGFSSGTINAIFMVYTFSLVCGFIKVYGVRFSYLLLIFLLMVPIVLAAAVAGFIFFVLTGFLLLAVAPLVRGKLLRRDIAQISGLSVFLVLIILVMGGQYIRFLTSPEAIIERSTSHGKRVGRLDQFGFAHQQINRNPKMLIFGLGPGRITHTRQLAIDGETRSEFYDEYAEEVSTRKTYMYITLELGYGGLIFFLLLHYKLFILSTRIFKEIDEKFWKAIALGFCGVVFTSAYSIVYAQPWAKPALVFPFWLMAGSLYRVGRIHGIFRE